MSTTKIAIIEDDPFISKMYKTKLTLSGYDVQTADDGEKGLKLIEEFKPDLVLMDLMMPNMSGVAALTKLRKLKGGKECRVIALTNMGDDNTIKTVKKLGVYDFVIKAEITPLQLVDKIHSFLSDK